MDFLDAAIMEIIYAFHKLFCVKFGNDIIPHKFSVPLIKLLSTRIRSKPFSWHVFLKEALELVKRNGVLAAAVVEIGVARAGDDEKLLVFRGRRLSVFLVRYRFAGNRARTCRLWKPQSRFTQMSPTAAEAVTGDAPNRSFYSGVDASGTKELSKKCLQIILRPKTVDGSPAKLGSANQSPLVIA